MLYLNVSKHWQISKKVILKTTTSDCCVRRRRGDTDLRCSISAPDISLLTLFVGGLRDGSGCTDMRYDYISTLRKQTDPSPTPPEKQTWKRKFTIDRLHSSPLMKKNWRTWNHFEWNIKAAVRSGLVVITPHRPCTRGGYLAIWPRPGPLLLISFGCIN